MPAKPLSIIVFLTMLFCLDGQCQKNNTTEDEYDRGYRYLYYQHLDSAFLMFNRYITHADDSLKKGKAYLFMGEMLWNIGDLYGAQETLMGSIRSLGERDSAQREFLGYTYNIMGNVSLDLKHYDEAIQFYSKAMPFSTKDYLPDLLNGKAIAFQKQGNYKQAISIYDSILASHPADKMLLARIIDNRAFTKWLDDQNYPALAELHVALKLRSDSQYTSGLNASYAHLSDFYANKNPDSALWYANKMLETSRETHSTVDELEALDKLVSLSTDADLKQQWYTGFKKLKDSVQFSNDTTRNRFALIRYDVQKSKADNLVLQQHITKQTALLYGSIALAVLVIAGLYTWYNRRKKSIQQDSENAIRNDRLKTSQKVHDVVANGLYSIMNELEHSNNLDREPMISRIESLYEKSRNISYEDIPVDNSANYDTQVHDLLTAFADDQTKLIIVGNQQSFWGKLGPRHKQELLLVMNELMVNMKKHSHAHNVSVVFKEENKKVFIIYKDDGVGFKPGYELGNGLKSTVNRIKSLGATINFEKRGKAGAFIEISFPLESSNT